MGAEAFTKDELFIRRTFDLAEAGRGTVSPNPLVGCVIVKDDKILAEGFHKQYGDPHAEVNAIESVKDKEQLRGATLYVNLEPCAHHGKTPPCADLIVQFPFKKVVLSNTDPNPLVAGKGIEKIRAAGIEVVKGVLKEEGLEFNKRFFTYIEKRRPYVILKWAQTSDGFIAREDFSSKWISNELSRQMVHKWRSEEDAVMVGTNTAIYDNPRLNVRDWKGKNPVRLVIDKLLKLPADYHLLDGSQKTIYYNSVKAEIAENLEYVQLDNTENLPAFILGDLFSRKIQSLIVEGGARLLNEFINKGLWDEIRMFSSKVKFEKGIKAPEFSGGLVHTAMIGDDELMIYKK